VSFKPCLDWNKGEMTASFWDTGSWSPLFLTSKNFKSSKKVKKNLPGCRELYALQLCKFIIRNTLYSVLGKNNKKPDLGVTFSSKI
jgi:hypothetical protein